MSNPRDLGALAEQMCRIEHKIDLLLEALASIYPQVPLRPVGDPTHIDPCSLEPVRYQIDIPRNHVIRQTNGSTGVVPVAEQASFPTTPYGGKTNE